MGQKRILIVEDEPDIAELLRLNLTRSGFTVISASSGEEGLSLAKETRPDLILLDLMLPGIDGMTVCKNLKQEERTCHLPVIMLTARDEEADIVCGLEVGADDYITKPFSPSILAAHIRAVLRRFEEPDPGKSKKVLVFGELEIDQVRHRVRCGGLTIELTSSEFRLLCVLARRPGIVFSRDNLVDEVRGSDAVVTDRTIDVHIAALRKKLGDNSSLIETIRGVGYRFREI